MMMRSRSRAALLAVSVVLMLGTAGMVAADTADVPVDCVISQGTLSCPLPAPETVTTTATATVVSTAVPPTVTVTATVTASPSSSVSPTPTVSTTTTAATTTAATTAATTTSPPAAGCVGAANTAGGPDPWGGCWPGPATTGVPAGTQLTVVNGNQTYSTAGAVIENKDIRGCVWINAANVTIKNSKINCNNGYVVYARPSGGRAKLTNVTISCNNTRGMGIGDMNIDVTRVDISGCVDGFDADNDITIKDSYIHDLVVYDPATDPHIDGIQSAVGSRLILDHSVWDAGATASSAINIKNSPGGPLIVDSTVNRNLIAGGTWALYCPAPQTQNFKITDNVFSRKYFPTIGVYGPAADCAGEIWSGNVYADTGAPVAQG